MYGTLLNFLFKQPNEFNLNCVYVVFSNKVPQRSGRGFRRGRPYHWDDRAVRLFLTLVLFSSLMSIDFILPQVGYDY